MKNRIRIALSLILVIGFIFTGCSSSEVSETTKATTATVTETQVTTESYSFDEIPEFSGQPSVVINNNIPEFEKSDYTTTSYESYGELDSLGRCTACIACIGQDIMPTEERGNIGSVKPTGWQVAKYNNVDGKYLYNRCHLIGYQLSAENANKNNLITGTRYMNVDGMLPYEDEVAHYVHKTNNHVLYRVTPIFKGNELVARGVQMEAYSIEDNGAGVEFNVYCYNNQPGIEIDYKTGNSKAVKEENTFNDQSDKGTYVVNTNTKKFHKESCQHAKDIQKNNKKIYTGSRQSLINNGYEPCKSCKP